MFLSDTIALNRPAIERTAHVQIEPACYMPMPEAAAFQLDSFKSVWAPESFNSGESRGTG